jgi:hypothetical protein
MTDPLGAKKFPRVIISPRAPKFPSVEIVPRTKRLLPVLILPVVFTVPSTSIAPRFFQEPWIYAEYPGSVVRVVGGGPTRSVLINVGPYTAKEDVAANVCIFRYGVLTKLWAYIFDVMTELTVKAAAFAIV